MLGLLRKQRKSPLLKIVLWGIIATFVGTIFLVWGKGRDTSSQNMVAIKINGESHRFEEYQRLYGTLYRLYQQVYQDKFNSDMEKQLGLRQQALDMLISQALLSQEAERQGLKVSRDELVAAIAKISGFQENGAFSRARYIQLLNQQQMTPEIFEEIRENELLIDKVRSNIEQTAEVSDAEILENYKTTNDAVTLDVLRLNPHDFIDQVVVTDEALQTFYSKRKAQWATPEKAVIRYLRFDPKDYLGDTELSQADIEKYYRQNMDKYDVPEQVTASHILVRIEPTDTEEMKLEKKKRAEKLLAQIKDGEDFTKLATKNSDDKNSARQEGSLGTFRRGMMVAPFEKAAFALQAGEISDIVETQFGYHIIKCTEHTQGGVKPLETVLDKVKIALAQNMAIQTAAEKAMDAYNRNQPATDIDAIATAEGLKVIESLPFKSDDSLPIIGKTPEIIKAAFAMETGEMAKPVNLVSGSYIFVVAQRIASEIPALDTVRADVESAYKVAQSHELARAQAEKILAEVKEGKDLRKAAEETGTEVKTTDSFTRASNGFIPGVGTNPKLVEEAFALTSEAPVISRVFKINGSEIVSVLNTFTAADEGKLSGEMKDAIQARLLTAKKNEVLNNKVNELRAKSEIFVAPQLEKLISEG